LSALIKDSELLTKEFGFLDWSAMKTGRIAFIERIAPYIKSISADTHIDEYLDWLRSYTPKIAAFAGSFFPIHKGHIDILRKAQRIFDKVILACGQNPSKPYTAEQITENVDAIRKVLPNTQVEFFPSFLTDYIESKPYPLTIVKGLRNPSDFDGEKLLLRWMEDLKPDIDVVYILSDRQFEHVSSCGVKMIQLTQKLSGDEKDLTSKYLPNSDTQTL
jgi:pantetheine-phosphate adenylyltransferase